MSSSTAEMPTTSYLNSTTTFMSWALTRDHKRIALMYIAGITFFFGIGGFFAGLIRLELLTPAGDLLTDETYNKVFTMHGVMMVFFVLIPLVPASLGNFLLPLMLGAKDVAFPKLNLLSFYIYLVGSLFTLWAIVSGGLDTGWTFYTPFSTVASTTAVVPAALGIFINGFSSILTGLNFMVTIHRMRAPGLTWFRLPLFVWAIYATSLIQVLGTPVVAITIVLVAAERIFSFGLFNPAVGGDPVLFQHLFWFYSHPAVYIMILPAMGVISEVIAGMTRKQIFGYSFVAFSSLGIAIVGFLVWGHHMFVAGISTYSALVFSVLTFLVAIPSAVKVFNWTATMYKGSVSWQTPMMYVAGFIGLFAIGGLTGLFLASMGLDVHVTDTYFVVSHFHYVMVGGAIMGFLAGIHYWWPKMTGRMYNEFLGQVSAAIIFIGFNLTFFPQFIAGYAGMPRRYHSYADEYQVWNVLSTAGASVLAVGFTLPLIYLAWSLKHGAVAGDNPWGAVGLEWNTTSPPPTENFPTQPIVTWEAYEYPTRMEDHVGGHVGGHVEGHVV